MIGTNGGTPKPKANASSSVGSFFKIKFGQQTESINMEVVPTKLCFTHQEIVVHMLVQCPFSKAVWASLAPWLGITTLLATATGYRRLQE
jgi:hypothetical protein